MRVHHIAIQVADLESCSRFYREVLGLVPAPESRPDAAWFRLGDALLMLEHVGGAVHAEPFATDRPGLHLLALAITAAERRTWEERFRVTNVEIVHQTPHTLYVRDPEGNRIALSSWPDAG